MEKTQKHCPVHLISITIVIFQQTLMVIFPLSVLKIDMTDHCLMKVCKIKFPFKKKGLPSCSASLHVKAIKYTCASDFTTLPRFFVQMLNMIKHFIVNLKKTSQLGRKRGNFVWEFQFLYRPRHAKVCRMTYVNTKGADQTVLPHSLIIAFVVRCLDSMVYILVKSKVSTNSS